MPSQNSHSGDDEDFQEYMSRRNLQPPQQSPNTQVGSNVSGGSSIIAEKGPSSDINTVDVKSGTIEEE